MPNKYKETHDKWNAEHREENRARSAKYDAEHREEIHARSAKYRAEHREEMRASSAKYRAKHKEEIRARSAKYDAEHREKRHAQRAKRYIEHREEIRAQKAKWYIEHREEVHAYGIEYYKAHKEQRRNYDKNRVRNKEKEQVQQRIRVLMKVYGLNPEDYAKMLVEQNGKCAICGSLPNGKNLFVDHDHITGKVRGLLCNSCNITLGTVKESTETLAKMIEYLRSRR